MLHPLPVSWDTAPAGWAPTHTAPVPLEAVGGCRPHPRREEKEGATCPSCCSRSPPNLDWPTAFLLPQRTPGTGGAWAGFGEGSRHEPPSSSGPHPAWMAAGSLVMRWLSVCLKLGAPGGSCTLPCPVPDTITTVNGAVGAQLQHMTIPNSPGRRPSYTVGRLCRRGTWNCWAPGKPVGAQSCLARKASARHPMVVLACPPRPRAGAPFQFHLLRAAVLKTVGARVSPLSRLALLSRLQAWPGCPQASWEAGAPLSLAPGYCPGTVPLMLWMVP